MKEKKCIRVLLFGRNLNDITLSRFYIDTLTLSVCRLLYSKWGKKQIRKEKKIRLTVFTQSKTNIDSQLIRSRSNIVGNELKLVGKFIMKRKSSYEIPVSRKAHCYQTIFFFFLLVRGKTEHEKKVKRR